MKEFVSAAKAAVLDDDEVIEFMVDGTPCKAYPPSPGQVALMYSALSEHARDDKRIAGIVDFFFGLLDDNGNKVLANRLLDRNDPFELDQLTEIMTWLVEQ